MYTKKGNIKIKEMIKDKDGYWGEPDVTHDPYDYGLDEDINKIDDLEERFNPQRK